jgi:hypothetical protein
MKDFIDVDSRFSDRQLSHAARRQQQQLPQQQQQQPDRGQWRSQPVGVATASADITHSPIRCSPVAESFSYRPVDAGATW